MAARKPLPKRVYLLGWISLWADVASEMVYPIIPIYATSVLMAQPTTLGLIEGFAAAIVSFMKGWSGWRSDRIGKRVPYIRWGYLLSAIGKPIVGLPGGWPAVFLGRSIDRFGKGIRTSARDALIADSVDKDQFGQAFGLHRTMDTTGAFLGGVGAVILLVIWPGDLRWIFFIAFFPGLVSAILTLHIRDAVKLPPASHDVSEPKRVSFSPAYWRAVVIALIFGLANSSDTFLLLRANEVFTREGSAAWLQGWLPASAASHFPLILTTFAYLLYNLAYIAVSYPAGVISDRVGRWGIIGIGWTLYAMVYTGFAYAGGSWMWPLFLGYGLYIGLADGVGKALVADPSPSDSRGTALGIYFMGLGFTTIIGNVLMGWLWQEFGSKVAFISGAALALVAVLAIPVTDRWSKGSRGPI